MIIKISKKEKFEIKVFECQEYKISENTIEKKDLPTTDGVYIFGENPDFKINMRDKIYGGSQFQLYVDHTQYSIFVMSNSGETIDKYYFGIK